jgi:tetratricopeptide (TPR) repeat protein
MSALSRHETAVALLPEGGIHCEAYGALKWRRLWLEDRYPEAVEVAERTSGRFPHRAEPLLEYSDLLSELKEDERARQVLLEATGRLPEVADVWYEAALACQRTGDDALASECFKTVWRLEAGQEPEFGFWLSEVEFQECVAGVLATIPEHLSSRLKDIAVVVRDYPGPWIVAGEAMNPRLLAMIESEPAESEEPFVQLMLYRWNIERISRHEAEVSDYIEDTVRRELAGVLDVEPQDLKPTLIVC